MKYIYKYGKPDDRAIKLTVLWIMLMVLAAFIIWLLWGLGGYATASTVSLLLAIAILAVFSVPRAIKVDDAGIEVKCVLDITYFSLFEIRSVRRVNLQEMKKFLPVFAGYGFFGYYGYYFDLKTWKAVRVYSKEWSDFFEIIDIYEKRYYISCTDPDGFLDAIAGMLAGEGTKVIKSNK